MRYASGMNIYENWFGILKMKRAVLNHCATQPWNNMRWKVKLNAIASLWHFLDLPYQLDVEGCWKHV